MKLLPLFSFIVIAIGCNSWFLDNTIDSGKEINAESLDYTYSPTTIAGLSGICPGKKPNTFLVVSDKTGIYEINSDGVILRTFGASANQDLEGICINPANNQVYVADETQMRIYRISDDDNSLIKILDIVVQGGVVNKGIEGIAFGKDTLYIVNQESPTLLIKYSLVSGKEVESKNLSFAGFLSDIFYDDTDHTLWIADSKEQKIFHCDLNGSVIGVQSIPYVEKAEALMVDRKSKIAWVGCDQKSYLYRIKLEI